MTYLFVVLALISLWCVVSFVVATVIGRIAAAGEWQHEMDLLHWAPRWR